MIQKKMELLVLTVPWSFSPGAAVHGQQGRLPLTLRLRTDPDLNQGVVSSPEQGQVSLLHRQFALPSYQEGVPCLGSDQASVQLSISTTGSAKSLLSFFDVSLLMLSF